MIAFELGRETRCPKVVFIYPKRVCPNLEMENAVLSFNTQI